MSSEDPKVPAVGSLLAVRNCVDPYSYLALVVNQDAGKIWVDRDPVLEYEPPSEENRGKYVIVRILGQRQTEGMALGKNSLPPQEPHEVEMVRWAYAQITQAWVVAGPDVDSIRKFLQVGRTYANLAEMSGATFFHDLDLLLDHLNGVTKTREEMGIYERRFRAMLNEVLPLPTSP